MRHFVQHSILNSYVRVVHLVSFSFHLAKNWQTIPIQFKFWSNQIFGKFGHTFDFGVLFAIIGGGCDSVGSGWASTALLAINLFVHTCFISCNTCSSTPSSKKESRTLAITSSITAKYSFIWNKTKNGNAFDHTNVFIWKCNSCYDPNVYSYGTLNKFIEIMADL